MDHPETRQALASREQELRTLLELSQAFGRELDPGAILARLGYALRGQLLVGRVVALLRRPEGGFEARPDALPPVPEALADLAAPALLTDPALVAAGYAAVVPLRAGDVSRGVVLSARARPAGRRTRARSTSRPRSPP